MSNTIALVDDDRNLLTSISIALEREGFKAIALGVAGEAGTCTAFVFSTTPRKTAKEVVRRLAHSIHAYNAIRAAKKIGGRIVLS